MRLFVGILVLSLPARAIEFKEAAKPAAQPVIAIPTSPIALTPGALSVQTPELSLPAAANLEVPTAPTENLAPLPAPLAQISPILAPGEPVRENSSEPSANATLTQAVGQQIPGAVLFDHAKPATGDASADATSGAPETARYTDVMVGVFDADDNLWLNANGVWVFRKGTDHKEKLRIPSEEFAHARQTVGKSGKYADYEYWSDQAQGSFWEFYDQPGRNPLLDNLKKMVAVHSPAQWQGKSWQAFVSMLRANPEGVHILTASGVSRKNFLVGLQFLKDQGFIDRLPPEENIQCVGNPQHPFYASTDSPSKAKLLTMKRLVLDRAQLKAQQLKAAGKRAPLILGPNGDKLEHLMPVGFSDDDPGNIAAMRDGTFDASGKLVEKGLAAEIAGGAWPDVKVTLFDSDPEDPKAVNVVIKRDGTLRQRTPADDASEKAP